jgi:hypothetical protein
MRKWLLGVSIVFMAETILSLAYSMEAKAQVPCQQQCATLRVQCLQNCQQEAITCLRICDNNYNSCMRSCKSAAEQGNSLIKQQTADYCNQAAQKKGLTGSDRANFIKYCVNVSKAAPKQ